MSASRFSMELQRAEYSISTSHMGHKGDLSPELSAPSLSSRRHSSQKTCMHEVVMHASIGTVPQLGQFVRLSRSSHAPLWCRLAINILN